MHLNILNEDQQKLLPLLSKFKREFYMVGGTFIALHIGHRLSIYFDLFKKGKIKPRAIVEKFKTRKEDFKVTLNIEGQKLFRGQLNYFAGINFDEQVDFIGGFETSEEKIKTFLNDMALTGF